MKTLYYLAYYTPTCMRDPHTHILTDIQSNRQTQRERTWVAIFSASVLQARSTSNSVVSLLYSLHAGPSTTNTSGFRGQWPYNFACTVSHFTVNWEWDAPTHVTARWCALTYIKASSVDVCQPSTYGAETRLNMIKWLNILNHIYLQLYILNICLRNVWVEDKIDRQTDRQDTQHYCMHYCCVQTFTVTDLLKLRLSLFQFSTQLVVLQ